MQTSQTLPTGQTSAGDGVLDIQLVEKSRGMSRHMISQSTCRMVLSERSL